MFRKLSFLALFGGAVAFLLKKRGGQAATPMPSSSATQPPSSSATQPDTASQEDLAAARPGQTQDTVESPVAGVGDDEEAIMPDTSADDPLVREQEAAAAADAGSIGGEADTVTAGADPEMRPVVEGAGDAPETFETTDEQGR